MTTKPTPQNKQSKPKILWGYCTHKTKYSALFVRVQKRINLMWLKKIREGNNELYFLYSIENYTQINELVEN